MARQASKTPAPAPEAPEVISYEPDPAALAALKDAIPDICKMMGVPPSMLAKRAAGVGPREVSTLALRKLALGAVALLGRSLELRWSALYGEHAPKALVGVQRSTLGNFADQFASWTGLDGYNHGKPTGYLAECARGRYKQIEEEAMRAVAKARRRTAAC